MTVDEARKRWEAAERAAVQAETKVAALGQAASDPRVGELMRQATELRQEADRCLRELIAVDHEDRRQD